MSDMRIPPQAIEVEKHVLGAMLLSRDAALEGIEILAAEDFYLERNRIIFDSIREITLNAGNADVLTLMEHLKKAEKLNKVGGEMALLDITGEVVSAASISDHAAIVLDKAVLRRLADVSARLCDYAYDPKADGSKGLEMAFTEILAFRTKETAGGLVDWRDGVKATVDRWGRIAAGEQAGIMTGLKDYDALIGGFLPSQLHLLAGRPGMGKSALVLQIAKAGGRVAIFSLESLMHEQVERVMAQEAGLSPVVFRSPESLRSHRASIQKAVAEISGYPIKVNDTTTINAAQIHSQCRKMKAKDGLDMVIVDYLQLVQAVGKHERREREIGSISESLKRMANDLNVPVLAVASLSRDCERREDKRPMLSDLRESGSLESDAHTVTSLYRESQYKKNTPDTYKNVAELSVLKNKNGPTGVAPFFFERPRFRFVDLEHRVKEDYKLFVNGGNDSASFMEGHNQ